MAQTAAHPADHFIPHVPARQWVLVLPIPLRLRLRRRMTNEDAVPRRCDEAQVRTPQNEPKPHPVPVIDP